MIPTNHVVLLNSITQRLLIYTNLDISITFNNGFVTTVVGFI